MGKSTRATVCLILLLLTVSAGAEDAAMDVDDECKTEGGEAQDACALSALQRKAVEVLKRNMLGSSGELGTVAARELLVPQTVSPASKEEVEILAIINEEFVDVKGPGSSWKSSYMPDETWQVCGAVDWSLPDITTSKQYRDGEEELGMMSKCKSSDSMDSLCKAMAAFTSSMRRLGKRFPKGPKFYNAFVTSWGEHNSWVNDSVGEVNYTARPPFAKVFDPNGIIEYAICDVIREILSQSPKQYGSGVCSHMAPLDALATKAPAKLLEMAVRLLWIGRHSTHEERPCSYVYERQPGIVPWKNGHGKWVPTAAADAMQAEVHCTGNAIDCSHSLGKPLQPIGLGYMWYAAATSEIDTSHGGSCDGREVNPLNYPGLSSDEAAALTADQAGDLASMLWACRHLTDPEGGSCRLRFNKGACNGIPFHACAKFSTSILPKLYAEKVLDFAKEKSNLLVLGNLWTAINSSTNMVSLDALVPESMTTAWTNFWGKDSHGKAVTEKVLKRMGDGSIWGAMALFRAEKVKVGFYNHVPSATEELLAEACEATVATLLISPAPFQFVEYLHQLHIGENFTFSKPFFGSNLTAEDVGVDLARFNPTRRARAVRIISAIAAGSRQPYGFCNHAVYLDKCDAERNEYTIWSWGKLYKVPREVLLGHPLQSDKDGNFNSGMVCAAVLADGISWSETDRSA